MLVELGHLLMGTKDQGRHPIGHLIEHCPLTAVDVDRADQHDVAIGAALAVIDGKQPGGLFIPQFERVENLPDIAVAAPARACQRSASRKSASTSPCCTTCEKSSRSAASSRWTRASRLAIASQPARSSSGGSCLTSRSAWSAAAPPQRRDPGKLLGQVVGQRLFEFIEQLGQLPHGDDSRRYQQRLPRFGRLDEQFEQTPPSPPARQRHDHPSEIPVRSLKNGTRLPSSIPERSRDFRREVPVPISQHA